RSLYKLKQYSRANYLYAYLFDKDPCAKYTSYQSFHPQEEADWKQTLQLAKTTAEKEVLWELFGIYADPVRAIKQIYTLNPKSDHLSLLLVRAVNLAEEQLLLNPGRDDNSFYNEEYAAVTDRENEYRYNYTNYNMDSLSQRS